MATTSASRIAHQDEARMLAEHNGQPWTPDEVEFVAAFTDDCIDAELAISLGRTLYAVENLQHRLRTTGLNFELARIRAARVEAAPVVACTRCFVELPAVRRTQGTCEDCA